MPATREACKLETQKYYSAWSREQDKFDIQEGLQLTGLDRQIQPDKISAFDGEFNHPVVSVPQRSG